MCERGIEREKERETDRDRKRQIERRRERERERFTGVQIFRGDAKVLVCF